MKRNIKLFIIIISLFLFSGLYAQQQMDGIIAVIGNNFILKSDLDALIAQYGFQNKVNPYQDPALLKKLQKNLLRQMIDQKLLLIKADEDTLKADEERVDQVLNQQVNTFIQQVGSQEKLEQYYGMPLPKIKKELRKQVEERFIIDQLRQKRFTNIKISRREIENFYKQYQDSLPKIEEKVDLSHILLQVKPNQKSAQAAYARLEEIKGMLTEGKDFKELAEQFSEDPTAKTNKGDLGWVSRGDFVKEFEEVAFKLNPDEVSDIVQTQFGFHLIKLVERQGEKIHAYHILIQLQVTEEDASRVLARLKTLREEFLSQKANWEDLALQNSDDPNVKEDKGHLGEFSVGNFQVEAFEKAIENLSEGEVSQPFKTEFGFHIIKLNKRMGSRSLTLEKDWQQIERIATDFKSNKLFQKWLEEVRQEIPVDVKIGI